MGMKVLTEDGRIGTAISRFGEIAFVTFSRVEGGGAEAIHFSKLEMLGTCRACSGPLSTDRTKGGPLGGAWAHRQLGWCEHCGAILIANNATMATTWCECGPIEDREREAHEDNRVKFYFRPDGRHGWFDTRCGGITQTG